MCPLSLFGLCVPCCPSLFLDPSGKACSALVVFRGLRRGRVVVHLGHGLRAHCVVRVLHVAAGVVSDVCMA